MIREYTRKLLKLLIADEIDKARQLVEENKQRNAEIVAKELQQLIP